MSSAPAFVAQPLAPLQAGVDPGSPGRRRIAAWCVIVCGLIVVALQQMGALQSPPPPVPTQTVQAPAAGDQPELATKMMVRLSEWLGNDPKNASMMVGNTLHPESEPGNVHAFRDSLTRAYFFGSQGWQSELDGLTKPLVPWSFEGADEDAKIVASILRGESVSDEARARLAERHGFYGKLAGVLDKPATDPTRAALLAGGGRLVAVLAGLGMLLLGVFLAALVCSIVAAINLLARDATLRVRWRLDVPAVGGSVLLETVAVFVAGFCALKLVLAGLEAVLPEAQHGVLGTVAMTLQWALILTPLWALTQGVSWAQLRQLLGLHKGEGLFKEIGCGLFAYFAGLPLVFVAIVVSLIAILVQGLVSGPGGGAPSNPIAELVTSAGAFELFMLFALASIWAPLVEETIFRGAFYRHIRGKRGVVLSGVVSAVLFAVMHGYPFFLLAPVTVLGFNFAMMREWRGSLVAPIVMHSLHNATTLIVVVSLMRSMM